MRRRAALAAGIALLALPRPAAAQGMGGAGSTLVFPLLGAWAQAYQRAEADAEFQPVGAQLDYEPIGSLAGLMRLRDGAVDFAATDAPLPREELTRLELAQFPLAIGGITVATSLPGIAAGRLRMTGALLAAIYLGNVTSWSDPAIRVLNPDLALPDAPIAVLRRADGSGTTFAFTRFLSAESETWRTRVGAGLLVPWPVGGAAKGNDGMAEALARTPNAIGYIDYAQARRAGLATAAIRNAAGAFAAPAPESLRAAAAGASWDPASDVALRLGGAGGADAYPVVATVYAVMRLQPVSRGQARAARAFFRWSLENGAATATALGYVALPREMVGRVRRYWAEVF